MPTRSVVLARLQLRFRRRALVARLAVVALALLTGALLAGFARRSDAHGSTAGSPIVVVVATADITPGTPLDANVRLAPRPRDLVPRGALTAVPAGRVATAFIADGEAVVPARVSGTQAAGPAGLLRAGERALTIPMGSVAPPIRVGDQVDVIATPLASDARPGPGPGGEAAGAGAPSGPTDARVVVRRASVVAVGPDGATVAVTAAQAPDLAAAIARSTVTLALTSRAGS